MRYLETQPKIGIFNHLRSKNQNGERACSNNSYFDVLHTPVAMIDPEANNMENLEAASKIMFTYAEPLEANDDTIHFETRRDFSFFKAGVQHNVIAPDYFMDAKTDGHFRISMKSFEYGICHNVPLTDQVTNNIRKYNISVYESYYGQEIVKESEHYQFGRLHSELDLPAVKYENHAIGGNKLNRIFKFIWKQFGLTHRGSGPAKIHINEKDATLTGAEYDKNVSRTLIFYKFGYIHNENGPAIVRYNKNDDTPKEEMYFLFGTQVPKKEFDRLKALPNFGEKVYVRQKGKHAKKTTYCTFNGKKHRNSNLTPAVIEIGPSGKTILEQYYRFGVLHRDGGYNPAVKKYFDSGCKKETITYSFGLKHGAHLKFIPGKTDSILSYKCLYSFGLKHNDIGPAEIFYSNKTMNDVVKVRLKKYYKMGLLHNENGPAVVIYSASNYLYKEIYYNMDKKHRLDGPAYIKYNDEGVPVDWHYIIFDKHITKDFLKVPRNLEDLKRLYSDENILIPEKIQLWIDEVEKERREDAATRESDLTTDSSSEEIL